MKKPDNIITLRQHNQLLEFSEFGAHILRWQCAGHERLYLSPLAQLNGINAIRGGIPVIFPQFSDRGALPKHGFARTARWHLHRLDESSASAELSLRQSAQSKALWPHDFETRLRLQLQDNNSLSVTLSVHNLGLQAFSFTCALHSYWRVDDIDAVSIVGLETDSVWDNVSHISRNQSAAKLQIHAEHDCVYHGISQALEMAAGQRRIQLQSRGFDDVVIWNPGGDKAKSIADLPPAGERNFVCIEPARIREPVSLQPDQHWQAEHCIRILN